jgi:hypothetical protein
MAMTWRSSTAMYWKTEYQTEFVWRKPLRPSHLKKPTEGSQKDKQASLQGKGNQLPPAPKKEAKSTLGSKSNLKDDEKEKEEQEDNASTMLGATPGNKSGIINYGSGKTDRMLENNYLKTYNVKVPEDQVRRVQESGRLHF